jgi:hypothetical protein
MRITSLMNRIGLTLLMVAVVTVPGWSQLTTADIAGSVMDSTGAIVPNATVKLEDLGTHQMRSTTSNSAGEYTFTFLQPGHYSLRVQSAGFSEYKVTDIAVNGGDHARDDAKLTIGSASQTVEVSSQTPLLQADSANVSSTIPEQAIENLPTAQRNLTSLVILTPGANEGASVDGLSSGARPDDRRLTSAYSINGEDTQLNNNQIDGTDNNERIIGTIGVKPLLDSIEEVTVQANDFTPETGRSAGGVISVLTKRGSNQLHGSLYEFLQNSYFNAKAPFGQPGATPEQRQNDFGGSIGGPIFKDKTFFFAGAEGFRLVQAQQNPSLSTVPTAAQEANPAAVVAADPYIPAGTPLDPIALNYLQLFPKPNAAGAVLAATGSTAAVAQGAATNNFSYQPRSTNYSYTIDARVDHQFNPNNLFYARYTSNHVDALVPSALPNQTVAGLSVNPGSGQYGYVGPATDIAYNGQLNYTHIFTPTLLMELKAAYTRINNSSQSPNSGTNAGTAFGFPGNVDYGPASTGLPLLAFNGTSFAPLGDANFVPIVDLTNTFQYAGTVTYTKGTHAFRAGGELIRRQARNQQSSNAVGSINMGLNLPINVGGTTDQAQQFNNNLAEFLVGGFTGEGRNVDLYTPDYRSWEPGFFMQDTWRATPKLTVVYGGRYDVYTPFTEAHGRISNYDPVNHVLLVPQTGYNFLQAQGANLAGVQASTPTAGLKTTYTNISPRVGFAYSVRPSMVIRGGFGLAFFPGNYTSNASLKNAPFNSVYAPSVNGNACQSTLANQIAKNYIAANPGTSQTATQPCNATTGANGYTETNALSQGIPVPAPQALNSANLSLGDTVALGFRTSYVEQFNLLVEQQFGGNVITVGYVGQNGRHLPATVNDINLPDPGTITPDTVVGGQLVQGNSRTIKRPTATIAGVTQLGSVGGYNSIGTSSYNSLQISFQRRFSRGLTVNSNYVWSHAIDDATDLSFEGQEGWGNNNPFNIAATEMGSSDLDLRNRFVMSGSYELQAFKNAHGLKRLALAGWNSSIIWIWNAGSPFSITDNYTGQGNSLYGPAGISPGPNRPLQIGNPKLAHRTINQWFNPLAFETPLDGQPGTTPRNSLTGPTFEHADISLFKNFFITERVGLEFRAEAFNVTNTVGYFVPNDQNAHATTNAVGTNPLSLITPQNPTPGNLVPGSGFAQIVSVNPGYVPRELQFALKLKF